MASHKYQDKRTKLPQVLLDQVNAKDGELASGASTSRRRIVDRRSARKSKREELKSKKSQFFSRKREEPFQTAPRTAPGTKRPAETAQDTPSKRPKIKDERQESKSVSSSAKFSASRDTAGPSVALSRTKPSTKPKPAQTPLERLAVKSISIRDASDGTPKTRKRQKDAEDDEIAWLEAKLGLGSKEKKGKGKSLYGNAFKEDGLDDILLDLDRLEEHVVGLDEDEGADDEDIHGEDDNTDEEESSSSEETNLAGLEEPHFGDDSSEHASDDGDVPILKEVGSSDAPKAAGAYVPPHLRQKVLAVSTAEADKKPEQTKLSRQLKGLLNRLSEQNIEGIVTEVEELYRSNPRNDVTQALTAILLNSVSSSANLLDTFVILHAAFIAAVHKIIGIEFAAYLVEQTVSSYEAHWTALRTTNPNRSNQFPDGQDEAAPVPTGSKESSNLLVLLSELYNFQVISCVLVYDLIRALLSSEFSEHDVELLLKVVKNSGHQMRQDDPLALKDIIQLVQAKVQGKNANELSSRFRFMVETLVNLKNNKMKDSKRAAGTGQNVASDAIERMKKYLSGIGKKRHVLSNEPLRVSLEDLHSSSKRGKWWLVGAAWGGDPLVENHNTKAQTKTKDESNKPRASITDGLSQLARQHGMNTEVRRNIFVVLVSSDDYVDACERLTQLELQETQQREIIRVILHCCGNERIYNPFYTLVAHHLCQNSHSHRVTLQYCLWDFLRSLGETQVGGAAISRDFESHGEDVSEATIINYAKAYAWWLARGSVTMTILKPVEFMVLQPRSKQFLKLMFLQMIINSQSNSPLIDVRSTESTIPLTRNRAAIEEIVSKALRIPTMCKGIAYFLRSILVEKDFGARTRRANELLVWGLTTAQEALQRDTLSDSDL